MKFKFLIFFLLAGTGILQAQDLTGIWRGYFSSGQGYFKQQYKYEIQIDQLRNKGLKGVTYSYRTQVFYGKANLQGIFMDKSHSLIIKEDSLLEVKMLGASEPCLMTCYLDYYKDGQTEVLDGTFTSINLNSKADCGSGVVYLERVLESDFHKEDFLVRKERKTIHPPIKKAPPKTSAPVAKNKPVAKPKPQLKSELPKADSIKKPDEIAITPPLAIPKEEKPKFVPKPKILTERENRLIRTIVTHSPDIKIELYDNGEIDGDTITVYHNNKVVVYKKELTHDPITLNIKANPEDTYHEFVMVADNLGRIPPNTALMVLTTGGKRYEISIVSNEQRNAKIVIEYKAE